MVVSLVTGRPRCAVHTLVGRLELSAPDITAGGACMFDPVKDCMVLHRPLTAEISRRVVALARKAELGIFFGTRERIFYEADLVALDHSPSIENRYLLATQDILAETDQKPDKITLLGPEKVLGSIEKDLRRDQTPVYLTYSSRRFLEINHKEVNKGSTLRSMAEYLEIPMKAILAVGDSHNDLSMFRAAGVAVAMGNAPEAVQRQADWIAPTNDDDGLVWLLERLI
jgi:Cof subfamily protein (haloacid dehalogenase superfamily)